MNDRGVKAIRVRGCEGARCEGAGSDGARVRGSEVPGRTFRSEVRGPKGGPWESVRTLGPGNPGFSSTLASDLPAGPRPSDLDCGPSHRRTNRTFGPRTFAPSHRRTFAPSRISPMKRILVLSSLLASGLASLAWSQTAAPAPAAPDPANFTGTVTPHPTTDIRLLRYSFEPAARTNWHSHAGGQVIFVEQGRMRPQERGGAGGSSSHVRPTSPAPAWPTGMGRCRASRSRRWP